MRADAKKILSSAVKTLERNPETSILITGSCDVRGSEEYNDKLGRKRGESVKKFMLDEGVSEDKVKIISRGKLDAVAPLGDPEGMQKDRNAHFVIAEVQEVMIPAPEAKNLLEQEPQVKAVEEGKYIVEKEENVESAVKVSQREYTIKSGDSLWKIAEKEMGSGHRWKYLYEVNKDRIANPKKLKVGRKIVIPVE